MTAQILALPQARSVTFTIPGRLGGKQRAGRDFRKGQRHAYNPKQTVMQEGIVCQLAALAMREQRCMQITGPAALVITIVRHTPSSWPKWRRAAAQWITGKPNSDNIVKLIADGLNHSGLWLDDAQVAVLSLQRRYQDDVAECVTVSVRELGPGDAP